MMRKLFFRLMLAVIFIVSGLSPGFAASQPSSITAILPKAETGDLDAMTKRRLVRILVPFSKTIYFLDKGRQFGTAVEFRAGSGNLHSGDKWNFCLTSA